MSEMNTRTFYIGECSSCGREMTGEQVNIRGEQRARLHYSNGHRCAGVKGFLRWYAVATSKTEVTK